MLSARASRLVARFTLAATLLGALAPAVSHTLAWARADTAAPMVLDICMAGDPRAPAFSAAAITSPVEPGETPTVGDQESATFPNHCPFCLLVAERLGPPPVALVHFFNADSGFARPDTQAPFHDGVIRRIAWPRGPPGPS